MPIAVKIIANSIADLPLIMSKHLEITAVPLNIRLGTQVYENDVEILPDEFYQLLVTSTHPLTTSQHTVGNFPQPYHELSQTINEIVYIHISTKLSWTLTSANRAREQHHGDYLIEVEDSEQVPLDPGVLGVALTRGKAGGKAQCFDRENLYPRCLLSWDREVWGNSSVILSLLFAVIPMGILTLITTKMSFRGAVRRGT